MLSFEIKNADGEVLVFEFSNRLSMDRSLELITRAASKVTLVTSVREVVKDRCPERMAG